MQNSSYENQTGQVDSNQPRTSQELSDYAAALMRDVDQVVDHLARDLFLRKAQVSAELATAAALREQTVVARESLDVGREAMVTIDGLTARQVAEVGDLDPGPEPTEIVESGEAGEFAAWSLTEVPGVSIHTWLGTVHLVTGGELSLDVAERFATRVLDAVSWQRRHDEANARPVSAPAAETLEPDGTAVRLLSDTDRPAARS